MSCASAGGSGFQGEKHWPRMATNRVVARAEEGIDQSSDLKQLPSRLAFLMQFDMFSRPGENETPSNVDDCTGWTT